TPSVCLRQPPPPNSAKRPCGAGEAEWGCCGNIRSKMSSPTAPRAPFPVLSLRHWHVIAGGGPGVDLARPADPGGRVVAHFLPLSNPPRQTPQRKHDRKHIGWDTHCAVDDAAVKIHVGVQLALDKIIVV